MRKTVRTAGAFLRRDARIAFSYRAPFLLDVVGAFFVVFEFSYLARLVPPQGPTGAYLAFVVTGLVSVTVLIAAASVMASGVRQEQLQGTLEVTLSSGISRTAFGFGLAAYPVIAGMVRAVIYLFVAYLFGARAPGADWSVAVASLMLGAASFACIGLAAVALVLVFRQGAGTVGWLLGAATVLAGVLFPVGLLPPTLRLLSGLSSATWTLRVFRSAVLTGASWAQEWRAFLMLVLLTIGYWFVAQFSMTLALAHTRRRGTLSQY